MPVNEEKAWEWARGNTSAEAYPIDQERFTMGKMRSLYYDMLAIVNEFMPASPAHPQPLFVGLSHDPAIDFYTRDFINKGAHWERGYEHSRPTTLMVETTNRAVRRGLGRFVSKPQIRQDNPLYGFHQVRPRMAFPHHVYTVDSPPTPRS